MFYKLFAMLGFAAILFGCSSSSTNSGEKVYALKGKIVSLDAAKKTVRIDHQDIQGLMKAMTMNFDVEDAKALDGLAADDVVEGKLKVVDGKYIITELHKTSGDSSTAKSKTDPEAEIQSSLAKLNEADRKQAEEQKWCPIAEERLGSMGVPLKIILKGQPVFLCCKACQKTAEKDADKTLMKVAELKKK